jgi:protein-tyrosine kinase
MAKFRDSVPQEPALSEGVPDTGPDTASVTDERSIGSIISETRNLSAAQVERVLAYQREHGVRFGEAAVALGLASTDDVLFALSQQFHYPYAPEESRKLGAELVVLSQPFSEQAEAFRALRSQVMMRVFGEPAQALKALAIVSTDSGDGKSYVAANLCVALAQLGGRTLLVDADMRSPRQQEIFRLGSGAGLSGILSGRAERKVVQEVVGIPSLFVLPVGVVPPNPLELVERSAFALLMRELCSKFDHVVVDTPATTQGSDGQVIAARCGAVLGVARRNVSRVAALQALTASIAQTPAAMLGFIVNEH